MRHINNEWLGIKEKKSQIKFYAIKNKITGELWNNCWGWMGNNEEEAEEVEITLFTENEKFGFHLPIDGEWILL